MDSPEEEAAIYAAIGRMIRSRRTQLGMTQERLARLMSMSRASIANIENGRQKLLVHTLFGFAGALQMAPAELLPLVGASETIKNLDSLDEGARDFVKTTIAGGNEGSEQSWRSDEEK